MKRKGFTLIELLAVIVILAVIAIIAVPMVMNVIEDSRKGAFKATCNQIYNAYEQYEISNELSGITTGQCTVFDFGNKRTETEVIDGIKYEPISKLNLKGEMPKLGTYKICNDTRKLVIDNGKYTCVKDASREEILEGSIADNDLTAPILDDIILSSTTNSIRVVVEATEPDGLITKYVYKLNGEEVVRGDNIYTFENLSGTEEFTVEVYVENKSGLKSESISKNIGLKVIDGTTYLESQTPEDTEYATSKKIEIKYDASEGVGKYFKSNIEAEVVSGVVVAECGSETDPGTCTTSSVTTIEAEKWYKTESTNPSVIYKTNGTLYTVTNDGVNTTEVSTYNVTKVDVSKPNVSISDISEIKTDRVTITAVCSDSESGITKYEYSDGTTWYNGGTNSSYTITGLNSEREYEFKVRCTNGAGVTDEANSSESTLGITNPSIGYENTPSTAVNGYLTSQVLKVTFSSTNIASPQYFIKTTRAGTSSIEVTEMCGSGDEPGGCTKITSTTSLSANTWYKASGNVNVTYSEYATSTGKLYAMTYDGTNYSGSTAGTISKITKQASYTVKHYQMNTDMTNYTLYEEEPLTGTANYTVTPSVKTYEGFTSPSTQTVTIAADGSTVVEYRYARKQTEVTFYRNTSTTDTTSAKQTFTYGVSGQKFSAKGWTRSGYTAGGWNTTTSGAYRWPITSGVGDNWINERFPSINLYMVWIKNPTLVQTDETIASGYTWATSRTIKITYDSSNMTSPTYYFKSSVSATVPSGTVTASCGSGDNPGTCTTSSVTTLVANTWYQTTNTTPSITFNKVGTLYAATTDGSSGVYAKSSYNVNNVDASKPSVSISDISDIKTDRVTITAVCSDTESGITKYEYSDGTTWYNGGTNSSYTITGLNSEKEYDFEVRCTNGAGVTDKISGNESTLGITNPSIGYENTPSTAVNGYLTSQILKVTFSSTNIASPQYFIKTTRAGTSSLNVTSTCGSGDVPGTCTSVTSTKSLTANTWYKVSGNVNVTYNEYATSTGKLYAITYDGTNYSGSSVGTISKITKQASYTVKHYQMNTDMTNYTLYETETLTGTANYTATPSVKTYTGFTSPSTQTVTIAADGSTVVEYRYARKQTEVTFYRNTSTTDTTTAKQTFTYGVSGQSFSAKGWTRSGYTAGGWSTATSGAYKYLLTSGVNINWINGTSPSTSLYMVWLKNPAIAQTSQSLASGYTWASSKVIKITYDNTNMASPTYYFKSSVSATVPSGTVTAACGTGDNPGDCTTSSVTTLVANTWYKTTSTTPSVTFNKTGTLYATTTDGTSGVYAKSSYNVTKVSNTTPTTPTITGGSEDWTTASRTISVSTVSTAPSNILKYQYYISTSSTSQTGGSWLDCTTTSTSQTITTNGTSYIFFRAVANNGRTSAVSNYQVVKISSGSYTKSEIDSLVNQLKTSVQNNATNIDSAQTSLDSIDLSKYATQQQLNETNNRVNELSEIIKSNSDRLTALEK